jgi:hypothetical protein
MPEELRYLRGVKDDDQPGFLDMQGLLWLHGIIGGICSYWGIQMVICMNVCILQLHTLLESMLMLVRMGPGRSQLMHCGASAAGIDVAALPSLAAAL